MLVPLLPVFLVASLNVNESDWKYGPEIIYDGSMNATSFETVNGIERVFVHNSTMKLKCRPKNQTLFSCRLHEPRIVKSLVESDGKHRVINDSKTFHNEKSNFTNQPFEFNVGSGSFDDHPSLYIIQSSMSGQQLNIVRALMDMINLPTYLPKVHKGDINIVENSTIGSRCKTTYDVKPIKLLRNITGLSEEKFYKIMIAPRTKIPKGEGLAIARTRYPRKCDYIMAGSYSLENKRAIERISSNTDILITGNSLSSIDQAKSTFLDGHHDNHAPAIETISLRLEDIVPASSPFPVIHDPMTFGTVGVQPFHSSIMMSWFLL